MARQQCARKMKTDKKYCEKMMMEIWENSPFTFESAMENRKDFFESAERGNGDVPVLMPDHQENINIVKPKILKILADAICRL